MIAWAHLLAWPVAVVLVSANLRRAIACVVLLLNELERGKRERST